MKKILAIVLTICLLVGALPIAAGAETTRDNKLTGQITQLYYKTLYATGEPNMDMLCGLYVAWQLYFLKVTTSPEIYNGSQYYSAYYHQAYSSGGHKISRYPGSEYTIEQALNAITQNGKKDVYNIVLCFDWTKNGGRFGHVMMIHGIVDGVVYAVDNFTTTIAGREGNPIVCSIERFADIYDGWSSFEGALVFGVKEYASFCKDYATDLFVQLTQPELLLSQPASSGSNGSVPVRLVSKGERLAVTDLVVGENGLNYYRVKEGGEYFYIPCAATQPILMNIENLKTRNIEFTAAQQPGDTGRLTGEIYSAGNIINRVELIVTDDQSETVVFEEVNEPRFNQNISHLGADFSNLAEGVYTVKIYATLLGYCDNAGAITVERVRLCVFEDTLLVGDVEDVEPRTVDAIATGVKHGWYLEEGAWRCYRLGEPRTGWYCYDGIDYYLQEDGSVTTGWANINGEDRFFSDTGAMRTGWLIQSDGVRYMLFNGVSAKGWREIDGQNYFFDENGILDEKAIG